MSTTFSRRALLRSALLSVLLSPLIGTAASYPAKPLSWIVAYPAGGGSDFLARRVASQLGLQLGQPIVVENRPGAATIIGAQLAARAAGDGYTLFTADNGSLIFNPALYAKLPYQPGDFAPIGLMARFPLLLVSTASSRYGSLKSVIDAARADPKSMQFASPGNGGPHHLAMELLKTRARFEAEHVPYKGAAPAVQDVLGGQVPIMILDTATAQPYLKAGKLKALGVASAMRLPQYPDVPTFKELGYDVEVYAWQGMAVPASTPQPIRDRLSLELKKALDDERVRKSLTEFGLEVTPSDARYMSDYIRSETRLWNELIRERGIKLEN